LARLNESELKPFKALVSEGVSSVMTAHLMLRKIDPVHPATFSKKVLTELLREKIGFKGLVVTDALVMQSVTKHYGPAEAAVKAFQAGADLLLMPENPCQAIEAMVDALMTGRVSMGRLEEALDRRRTALSKVDSVNLPFDESLAHIEQLKLRRSNTLESELINKSVDVRNCITIDKDKKYINLIRVDGLDSTKILNHLSPALLIPQEFGLKSLVTHSLCIPPWDKALDEPLVLDRFEDELIMLQLFVRGNPFQGDAAFNEPWVAVVKQLQRHKCLAGLVVYGSYYLWSDLLQVLEDSIPVAFSPGQMPLAQQKVLRALFQNSKRDKGIDRTSQPEFID